MDKEKAQQEYMRLQMLDRQMKELQNNIQNLENQLAQMKELKDSVGKVDSFKEGSKMQAPISPGVYVESELKDSKEVLVSAGNNIFVKKDLKSAQELVQKRIDRIQKISEELTNDLQDLSTQARESQEKLQKYV